ncbi:MAG: hypothetical protein OHK0048_13890 [Rhodoferax sp.]
MGHTGSCASFSPTDSGGGNAAASVSRVITPACAGHAGHKASIAKASARPQRNPASSHAQTLRTVWIGNENPMVTTSITRAT